MDIVFLPVLAALLTGSIAYSLAWSRHRDVVAAAGAIQRYATVYVPLLSLALWLMFALRFDAPGIQYLSSDAPLRDLGAGLGAGALLGYGTWSFVEWTLRRQPDYRHALARSRLDTLSLLLLAPLVEEILFRGFGFTALADQSITVTLLATATAFALWHANPYLVPPAFVFGLAMGGLYLYTQSLLAPVVAHAVSNFAYWRWSGFYRPRAKPLRS